MSRSPTALLDIFQDYYGPTMNAFAAAKATGREADLRAELETLFFEQNVSGDPHRTRMPATYLQVAVEVV